MILMMCFELTRLFCLNEWIKKNGTDQTTQDWGGSEDSIYTFEPKVIALFGGYRGESEED